MRILITNILLSSRTGTEVVTCELAAGFAAAGHGVAIFSPEAGESAEGLRRMGIPVLTTVPDSNFRPDIIHGHHNVPLVQALIAYPGIPAVFVCHDAEQWTDSPPAITRIRRYVAVDKRCAARIARDLNAPIDNVPIVHNAVDLARFEPKLSLPPRPNKALLVAKQGTDLEAVRMAAKRHDLALDEAGPAVGQTTAELHKLFQDCDVVFATARTALEAAAAGCAVILVDGRGCGGLVTQQNMETYRDFNFGAGVLTNTVGPELLGAELDRYSAADASAVTSYIRENNGLDRALNIYLQLYSEILSSHEPVPLELEASEISRAINPWLPRLDTIGPLFKRVSEAQEVRLEPTSEAQEDRRRSRRNPFSSVLRALKIR